jgi:hypothetical protein
VRTSTVEQPRRTPISSTTFASLVATIVALAGFSAGIGLLQRPDPVTVLTVRGDEAQLYGGEGVYRHETLFVGALNQGTDVVTLLLGIPLLLTVAVLARRDSPRAIALLPGAIGWFLYVYATMAVRAAFNALFIVYVGLFSASLYAFVLALAAAWAVPLQHVRGRSVPRRSAALLLIVSGIATAVIWLGPIIGAQLAGEIPERLDTYPTFVTEALDAAVITPAVLVAGFLILRRDSRGYVLAVPLLVLETLLAPMITVQTVSQISAGITLTPAEVVGPVAGFVGLALAAGWVLVRLLRSVADRAPAPALDRERLAEPFDGSPGSSALPGPHARTRQGAD